MNRMRFYLMAAKNILPIFTGMLLFFLPSSLQSQEIEWEEVTNGIQVPYVLSIHEDYEGGIYANTGGGLYYSSDHGGNWEKICDSTFKHLVIINKNIFLGSNKIGLYNLSRTFNRGKTWETIPLPINKEFSIDWLCNDSKGNIYISGYFHTTYFRRSYDLGNKWDTIPAFSGSFPSSPSNVCEGKKGTIYFTYKNYGTFSSTDAGNTSNFLTTESGYWINADRLGNIWAIDNKNKTVYSTDEGKKWHNELLALEMPNGLSDKWINSEYLLFTFTIKYGVVYIPEDSSFVSISHGGGINKVSISKNAVIPLIQNVPNYYTLCIFRDTAGYIYAGTQGGIYRSSDKGMTWHHKGNGMNQGSNIFDFLIDPLRNEIYIATSAGIFRSSDNIQSWELLRNGMVDAYTTSLGRAKNGNLLAGNLHGLYYSTNNGIDWKKSNIGDDKYELV